MSWAHWLTAILVSLQLILLLLFISSCCLLLPLCWSIPPVHHVTWNIFIKFLLFIRGHFASRSVFNTGIKGRRPIFPWTTRFQNLAFIIFMDFIVVFLFTYKHFYRLFSPLYNISWPNLSSMYIMGKCALTPILVDTVTGSGCVILVSDTVDTSLMTSLFGACSKLWGMFYFFSRHIVYNPCCHINYAMQTFSSETRNWWIRGGLGLIIIYIQAFSPCWGHQEEVAGGDLLRPWMDMKVTSWILLMKWCCGVTA